MVCLGVVKRMQNTKINNTTKIKPHQFVIIYLTPVIPIIKRHSQT